VVLISFFAIAILSIPYLNLNSPLTGVSFLFIYLFIASLKLFAIGMCQMLGDEEKGNKIASMFNFENLSRAWFDFIKWLLIIGGLSLLFERTQDIFIMIILYISYFLLYCHILDVILSWVGSAIAIHITESTYNNKSYFKIFGREYEQTAFFLIIKGLIGIISLMFLTGAYIFMNHIATKLQTT